MQTRLRLHPLVVALNIKATTQSAGPRRRYSKHYGVDLTIGLVISTITLGYFVWRSLA